MPGTKKKRTPLSPEEIARRKQASETDRHLHGEPDPKGFSQVGGKAGKFTPKKSTNFRHQGR
jgi:hypothetical protein